MQIVNQSVELIDDINGEQILKKIELCGRVAYKSEDKITEDSAKEFVRKIIKSGHESVIEHISVTVRCITDRGMCYSNDTKVLTKDGFKLFSELDNQDTIITYDGNQLVESTDFNIISKKYCGKMLNFHNTFMDILVTPNHNMYLKEKIPIIFDDIGGDN